MPLIRLNPRLSSGWNRSPAQGPVSHSQVMLIIFGAAMKAENDESESFWLSPCSLSKGGNAGTQRRDASKRRHYAAGNISETSSMMN
jgi:hypothetical protein